MVRSGRSESILPQTQPHRTKIHRIMNKKRDRQAVHWFLTINNPTEIDSVGFTTGGNTMAPHLKYLMMGYHEGEKNKVPHIHAVIWLKTRKRLSALKKLYPRADIRERLGSIESCAVYLNKFNGSMKEWGERP